MAAIFVPEPDEHVVWTHASSEGQETVLLARVERHDDSLGRRTYRYVLACSCGHGSSIAGEQPFALSTAAEHLRVHRPMTAEDVFDRLF